MRKISYARENERWTGIDTETWRSNCRYRNHNNCNISIKNYSNDNNVNNNNKNNDNNNTNDNSYAEKVETCPAKYNPKQNLDKYIEYGF